jgi:hypothetical protein
VLVEKLDGNQPHVFRVDPGILRGPLEAHITLCILQEEAPAMVQHAYRENQKGGRIEPCWRLQAHLLQDCRREARPETESIAFDLH